MPTYRAYTNHYGSTSASASTTWQYWTTADSDSTATLTTDITWTAWANDTTSSCITYATDHHQGIVRLAHYEDPPEVEAARRELQQSFAAEQERKYLERYEAEKRAEALLLDNLDDEQARNYRDHKHIIIVGGYSGTRYRLRISRTGNIDVIDTQGRVSHRLCAHPREDMPDCDVVLIQKLMIEADERAFLKVANRHPSFNRDARVLPPLTS